MHKKTVSLLAMVVALSGFALAVFIPSASASKAHDTYTQYCENGTNTVYSAYNQYCEPTTTTGTTPVTTTVTTSPTTPITTTTGTTTTGTTTTGTTTTTPPNPGPPTTVVGGIAILDLANLYPGETFTQFGVTVKVLSYTKDGVEISFGGVDVDVPYGALVSIAKDGVVNVSYSISGGKISARVAHAVGSNTKTRQYMILPKGRSSKTASYALPKGVSLGAETNAQIAKDFTVYTLGKKAVKVGLKVSANKARSFVKLNLAKAEKDFVIYFNVSKLKYSKSELASIKHHKVKRIAPAFKLTSKTSKAHSTKVDKFAFSYPV